MILDRRRRKRTLIAAAALAMAFGISCSDSSSSPAPDVVGGNRQALEPGRLGEPLSEERQKALLEAGWLKAIITAPAAAPVDIAVPSEKVLTGYALISWQVPLDAVFFIDPIQGRVVYQDGGYPGLVHQLVEAGHDFKIVESRNGDIPSREELGKLKPVPQDLSIHPVVPGGLSEEQVRELLAAGWKDLPPGNHTAGVVLFRDPQLLTPEGLYLGWAAPELQPRVLGLAAQELPGGGDCTCVMPECGNKYKCPCVALKDATPAAR